MIYQLDGTHCNVNVVETGKLLCIGDISMHLKAKAMLSGVWVHTTVPVYLLLWNNLSSFIYDTFL